MIVLLDEAEVEKAVREYMRVNYCTLSIQTLTPVITTDSYEHNTFEGYKIILNTEKKV